MKKTNALLLMLCLCMQSAFGKTTKKSAFTCSLGVFQQVKILGSHQYNPGTDNISRHTSPFAFKSGRIYTGPVTIGYHKQLNQ